MKELNAHKQPDEGNNHSKREDSGPQEIDHAQRFAAQLVTEQEIEAAFAKEKALLKVIIRDCCNNETHQPTHSINIKGQEELAIAQLAKAEAEKKTTELRASIYCKLASFIKALLEEGEGTLNLTTEEEERNFLATKEIIRKHDLTSYYSVEEQIEDAKEALRLRIKERADDLEKVLGAESPKNLLDALIPRKKKKVKSILRAKTTLEKLISYRRELAILVNDEDTKISEINELEEKVEVLYRKVNALIPENVMIFLS